MARTDRPIRGDAAPSRPMPARTFLTAAALSAVALALGHSIALAATQPPLGTTTSFGVLAGSA